MARSIPTHGSTTEVTKKLTFGKDVGGFVDLSADSEEKKALFKAAFTANQKKENVEANNLVAQQALKARELEFEILFLKIKEVEEKVTKELVQKTLSKANQQLIEKAPKNVDLLKQIIDDASKNVLNLSMKLAALTTTLPPVFDDKLESIKHAHEYQERNLAEDKIIFDTVLNQIFPDNEPLTDEQVVLIEEAKEAFAEAQQSTDHYYKAAAIHQNSVLDYYAAQENNKDNEEEEEQDELEHSSPQPVVVYDENNFFLKIVAIDQMKLIHRLAMVGYANNALRYASGQTKEEPSLAQSIFEAKRRMSPFFAFRARADRLENTYDFDLVNKVAKELKESEKAREEGSVEVFVLLLLQELGSVAVSLDKQEHKLKNANRELDSMRPEIKGATAEVDAVRAKHNYAQPQPGNNVDKEELKGFGF